MGYEAQYNGKEYIAKKEDVKNEISKKLLKQEKKLLAHLKHACVIQQLATFDTVRSSVLLMEKMWMSLSEFITSKHSYHDKISILHDTVCGLQYIHERGIIHCNMTADNILLTENVRAKLADFGQAIFCQQTMIMKYLPKNLDHLPPEVLKPYGMTSYSTKVDVFSFGCVIIHIFTREHPTPDFGKYVEMSEAGKYRHHSEIDRRSICLRKFRNNCNSILLHSMMLRCLQDNPDYRPAATTLCSILENQLTRVMSNSFKYGMCNVAVKHMYVSISVCVCYFTCICTI